MKWTLQKKKIKDLKNNPKNPRRLSKHDAEHLRKSIDSFGQCEPVVVNTDGSIIGGHQRVRIMKRLGYKEVDVYVPERLLSDKEADELNIRLNRNHGEWDFDILANEWEIPDLVEWGFLFEEIGINEDDPQNAKEEIAKSVMTISFAKPEDLQHAENRISVILDEYEGCAYKIKV